MQVAYVVNPDGSLTTTSTITNQVNVTQLQERLQNVQNSISVSQAQIVILQEEAVQLQTAITGATTILNQQAPPPPASTP
jgi:hypothetical protein